MFLFVINNFFSFVRNNLLIVIIHNWMLRRLKIFDQWLIIINDQHTTTLTLI